MKEKICPRCGTKFFCNHEDISNCQCAAIKLSAEVMTKIKNKYSDCLCLNCLKEINRMNKVH